MADLGPPQEVFNHETKQFERNTTRVLGHVHGRASHAHAWGDTPHDHLLRAVCGRSECQGMTTHNIHCGSLSSAQPLVKDTADPSTVASRPAHRG